ncbi:kazal-type serine protease inhibitor domain-containing protein [Phthorimaea operculella]|nr:kazal-type serine protease inhibitor domain-containing protein [Phthorimaea operculella]
MTRCVKWWILTISVFTFTFLPPIKSSNSTKQNFNCSREYTAFGKVCASDNVTYENLCEFEHAKIENKPNLAVRYFGECVLIVKKDTKCDHWDPICGNDYLTYKNDCHFQRARKDRPLLKIVHTGECLTLWGLDFYTKRVNSKGVISNFK